MSTTSDIGGRIRLGVIGAGRIAQVAHMPALAKAKNIELVAISDPSETLSSGVAAKYGIKPFTNTERLLAEDLDAVLIATPDRFHHPLGMLALKAGKHVLMEKPLAGTVAEAQELADLAAAAGLRLQTGAMKRHDPGLAFAKAHIDRIGPILSFISYYRVMSSLRPATEATLFPGVVVDQQVRRIESTFKAERARYLLAPTAHTFSTVLPTSVALPPGSAPASATSAMTTPGMERRAWPTVTAWSPSRFPLLSTAIGPRAPTSTAPMAISRHGPTSPSLSGPVT